MEDVVGALGGFRGVRAELLVALKKAQPLTAHELGEQFGLTANGLRRHLKALEDDGLVRYERAVRGVGAPVYAYSLTAAGEALFPRSYVTVLSTALEALRAQRGSSAVEAVLDAEWNRLAEEAGPVLEALPLEERVPLVAELLTAKGYMCSAVFHTAEHAEAKERSVAFAESAEGEGAEGESAEAPRFTLRIHNCAVREIAEQFPEACRAEEKFVERLLGVPLVRAAHRRDGCGRCEYGVTGHLSAVQQEQA